MFAISTTLISTATMAQSYSNASISNTGYQLIDLNPGDGIAAGISFFSTSNAASASVLAGTSSDGYSSSAARTASSLRAISVAVGDTSSGAAASYSGGPFGALAANGQVDGLGTYSGNQSISTGFTLTPNTVLVVFGQLSGTAIAGSYYNQYTGSSASVSLTGNITSDGRGYQSSSIGDNAYSYYYLPNQFSHSFAISFVNGNATELSGVYNVATSVSGANYAFAPSPVPEPETCTMMLAGLTVLGALARRRARNRLQ